MTRFYELLAVYRLKYNKKRMCGIPRWLSISISFFRNSVLPQASYLLRKAKQGHFYWYITLSNINEDDYGCHKGPKGIFINHVNKAGGGGCPNVNINT